MKVFIQKRKRKKEREREREEEGRKEGREEGREEGRKSLHRFEGIGGGSIAKKIKILCH